MKRILLTLTLFLFPLAAQAEMETYQIDPTHSQIGFKIKHMFSKVPGRFTKFEGTIEIDPQKIERGNVAITIDTTSINTDNEKRDAHLRGSDFFEVEKYPTIKFYSTRFTKKGRNKIAVRGNLSMHGVTRPATMMVNIKGFGADAWGNYRAGFEGSGTLDRKEFGIEWNKALDTGGFLLGNDVDIDLAIEGIRQTKTKRTAGSKPKKN